MKKKHFGEIDRKILITLNRSRSGISIYDISKQTGISCITVKKHLNKLIKKDLVLLLDNIKEQKQERGNDNL